MVVWKESGLSFQEVEGGELGVEEQEEVYRSLVERTRRALYTGGLGDPGDVSTAENSMARAGVEITYGSGEYFTPQVKLGIPYNSAE